MRRMQETFHKGSSRHLRFRPLVDILSPLLLELFSATPVTFPGNNLLLCFGEAQPLFLHSVLLIWAQAVRRESSRKWEGVSGVCFKLPRRFDVLL